MEPVQFGKTRYAIYNRLKKASRLTDMTDAGPIPRQHRVLGDAAEAEGLDSPVLIDCVNMRDSTATDSLWFEIRFIEIPPRGVRVDLRARAAAIQGSAPRRGRPCASVKRRGTRPV